MKLPEEVRLNIESIAGDWKLVSQPALRNDLQRIAALVAADCARVCDDIDESDYPHRKRFGHEYAVAIRQRYGLDK